MPGWKVTNRIGWTVDPGSITMAFLCNGDNQPEIQRDRYIITPTAPRQALVNAWDRCSGRVLADTIDRDDLPAGAASDE